MSLLFPSIFGDYLRFFDMTSEMTKKRFLKNDWTNQNTNDKFVNLRALWIEQPIRFVVEQIVSF